MLQKKILKRMHELGMIPVLPGRRDHPRMKRTTHRGVASEADQYAEEDTEEDARIGHDPSVAR